MRERREMQTDAECDARPDQVFAMVVKAQKDRQCAEPSLHERGPAEAHLDSPGARAFGVAAVLISLIVKPDACRRTRRAPYTRATVTTMIGTRASNASAAHEASANQKAPASARTKIPFERPHMNCR